MERHRVLGHARGLFVVLAVGASLAGTVVVSSGRGDAESPAGSPQLDREIAAVERDVHGTSDPRQRTEAQAKLNVLLHEKRAQAGALAAPPNTEEDDARKFAELDAFSRETKAATAAYSPLIRVLGTGVLVDGTPWNTNDKSFGAGPPGWWLSPIRADGTRLAVWAGAIRATGVGAVLIYTFEDGNPDRILSREQLEIPVRGTLSIEDEQDGVLALRSATGATIHFDTATLTVP